MDLVGVEHHNLEGREYRRTITKWLSEPGASGWRMVVYESNITMQTEGAIHNGCRMQCLLLADMELNDFLSWFPIMVLVGPT